MSTPEQDCENNVWRAPKAWAELYQQIPPLEVVMRMEHIRMAGGMPQVLVTHMAVGHTPLKWVTGFVMTDRDYMRPPNAGWYIYGVRERP